MPTTALQLFGENNNAALDAIKLALRVDGDYLDNEIVANINAGVQAVQKHSGILILDQTKTVYAPRPNCSENPIVFAAEAVKSITSIKYWTPSQKAREEPMGTVQIAPSDPPVDTDNPIGRTRQVDPDNYEVWPPANDWPEILDNTCFEITFSQGRMDDLSDLPYADMLKRAIILWAARGIDGIAIDPGDRAYWNIIAEVERGTP